MRIERVKRTENRKTRAKNKQQIMEKKRQYLLVLIHVNRLKLAETNKVSANEDTQFTTFLFTLLTVTRVTLMLHSDP